MVSFGGKDNIAGNGILQNKHNSLDIDEMHHTQGHGWSGETLNQKEQLLSSMFNKYLNLINHAHK